MRTLTTVLAMAALAAPAAAQRPRAQAAPPPAPPAAAATAAKPASGEPQRTTASFDDWTLRCMRAEGAAPACEVTQTVFDKDRPVAQTAIGRPAKDEPLRLTILVPVNVQLGTPPRLEAADGQAVFELGWRRCLPAGCLADAPLNDDQLQGLRTRTEAARVSFKDAAGRTAVLPFTARGLSAALDALAKENGS